LKKTVRAALSLVAAVSVGMAGCSLPNSSQSTSLQVDDTGAVTETIVEDRDGDYTEDELTSYIRDSVSAYNTGKDSAVSLDSCSVNGNAVKIVMKYATVQDYSAYNSVTAFLGTLEEAEAAGYDIGQNWMTAGGETAAEDDMSQISARKEEWKVFIVSEPVYVRVPDKILYTTDNVTVTGRLTANVDSVMSSDITNPAAEVSTSSGNESVNASSAVSTSSAGAATDSTSSDSSGSTAMYSVTAVSSDAKSSASSSSTGSTSASSTATSGSSSSVLSGTSSDSSVVSSSGQSLNANGENEKFVTVANEYAYIIYK
jgi:hypothetical protein